MSDKYPECSHTIQPDVRRKQERFLEANRTYWLEEVLDIPLHLSRQPFEINTLSPTPLDPMNLYVHGIPYAIAAMEHMRSNLFEVTEQIRNTHPKQIENAEGEIEFQHRHRMQKNDDAMNRWREKAAIHPKSQLLSHAEAEGVLQVRAGTSKIGPAIRLLAKNPEMKAIETSKATRPFCSKAFVLARTALDNCLQSLASSPGLDMIVNGPKESAPYRFFFDRHHQAFVGKAVLALATIDGVDIEVVGRESSLAYNPETTPPIPESQPLTIGALDLNLARVPLDMTSYVRVTSSRISD